MGGCLVVGWLMEGEWLTCCSGNPEAHEVLTEISNDEAGEDGPPKEGPPQAGRQGRG